MNKAQLADEILKHYIILALEHSGVRVDTDTHQELTGLIENAINEAVEIAVERAVREALQCIPTSVLE